MGYKGFFLAGPGVYDVSVFTLFLFQMVFMDTAATIPTGAMAERWKFSAFIVYGFFISMITYPIYRQLGLGRRLAVAVGRQFRPGPRGGGFCRFRGGPHGGRRDGPGRGHRAGAPDR